MMLLCNLHAGLGLCILLLSLPLVSLPLLPHDYIVGAFTHGYLDFLVRNPNYALCVAGLCGPGVLSFG